MTLHIQSLSAIYGLHQPLSGSTSLLRALRRSSIRFMLRTADLLSHSSGILTYRFNTGITSYTGYILHGSLVLPWQDFHLQAFVGFTGHTKGFALMIPFRLRSSASPHKFGHAASPLGGTNKSSFC